MSEKVSSYCEFVKSIIREGINKKDIIRPGTLATFCLRFLQHFLMDGWMFELFVDAQPQ